MTEVLDVVCTDQQAIMALNIAGEANNKGARIIVQPKIISLEKDPPSWPFFVDSVRFKILEANGGNENDFYVRNHPSSLKERPREASYTFNSVILEWRDQWNSPVNPQQKPQWYRSDVISDLLGLYHGKYPLTHAIFWNLGSPDFYLESFLKYFKDTDPDTSTYLFSHERIGLIVDRKIITHQTHASFEAYRIAQDQESGLPALFKVRAMGSY